MVSRLRPRWQSRNANLWPWQYKRDGEYEDAVAKWLEIVGLQFGAGDTAGIAASLMRVSSLYQSLDKFDDQVMALEQSLALTPVDDDAMRVTIRSSLAASLASADRFEEPRSLMI